MKRVKILAEIIAKLAEKIVKLQNDILFYNKPKRIIKKIAKYERIIDKLEIKCCKLIKKYGLTNY